MSNGNLDIKNTAALHEMAGAMGRFGSQITQAVSIIRSESQRAIEKLRERTNHWHRKVEHAHKQVELTSAMLRRCENSSGNNDCSRLRFEYDRARANLREYERNLEISKQWQAKVEQEVASVSREIQRLQSMAEGVGKGMSNLRSLASKYDVVHSGSSDATDIERAIAEDTKYYEDLMAHASQMDKIGNNEAADASRDEAKRVSADLYERVKEKNNFK